MRSLSTWIRRILGLLLEDPATLVVLVSVYVVAGAIMVVTDYTLNDEGLLTYYWASWARQDFIPVFFFQRIRPIAAALYLPASPFGTHWTLIFHVVVAALSLPMLATTARALGHRFPNLPALITALSPLYVYGGPAGISNTDGVVGMVLALYLLSARRRPLLAGLVVGLLPWLRVELSIFCAAMALHGIVVRRDRSLLAGIAAFPLLYATAGAFYHHDVSWIVHFPPKTPADPVYTSWTGQHIGVQYFLEPLLAVSPIVPLVVALRLARLPAIERTLLGYSIVTALIMNVVPIFHLANFGTSPRYSLALLPPLALLTSRAVEPWLEGRRPPLAQLVAMVLVAAWLTTRQQDTTAVAFLLIATLVIIAAIGLRLGTSAVALAIVLIAAGPIVPISRDIGRTITAPYLDPMVDWLQAHHDRITGPVLTNSQLLASYAEYRLPGVEVQFVISQEMTRDMMLLSNPANGQQDRILHLCETDLYGHAVFGPISPERVPPAALLALRVEQRMALLFPDAIWGSRLEVMEDTPRYRIARVLPTSTRHQ